MNLCIDIGNTTTKLGIFQNDELIQKISFTTDINKTSDELSLIINDQIRLNNIDISKISNIIFGSVVPRINFAFKEALKKLCPSAKFLNISPGIKTGLCMKIDNPNEVGSDLIADLVGAKEIYGYPTLIVDLGTATKILLIDKNGIFTSCVIMPGINISASILSNKAALLPEVSLESPKPLLECKNTAQAMNSGILFGHLEMIKGIVNRYENELGYDCNKILTGGASKYIVDFLSSYKYEKDLSLLGLNFIGKRNEGLYEK